MERAEALVIDASVAVKWFNEEEYSPLALRLRELHIRGQVDLTAPVLVLFEVANALRYSPEYGAEDVRRAIAALFDLQISLRLPEREWMQRAAEISFAHGVSIYDACYLALSEYLGAPIYTADEELLKRVEKPLLKHIREAEELLT